MITLRDVRKSYPGGVHALAGVSLHVEAGELVAIVGPSGSGKTTMLNMLGTLDRPTSGEIRIDGHDVGRLADARLSALRASRIGFVFQHFHLAAGTRAIDNVADGLLYSGLRPAARRRRPRRRWSGSGSATGWTTSRTSCPAESGSGSRSRGRSPGSPRCCSRTSRPARWTRCPARG